MSRADSRDVCTLERKMCSKKIYKQNRYWWTTFYQWWTFKGKPSIPGSPLQASNISKDKVTLSWKPSSNEGGSPITSYIIESRDGIQGIYVPAGKTDRQTHSLTVDKLKNGKDYYFRVCAENALGRSDYLQMEKAIAPMSEFDKPSAAEGPLEVTEVTDKSAQLSWKPPKLNGGEPLTGYIIERREDKCQYWTKLEKISSDTTTFKVKNMSEENNYFFRVLAENEEGTSPALETREPVKPVKISVGPKRHVWSSQEKEAIERQLKDYIRQGKTPGQLPCLNAIRKEPILAKYTWDKIKHATRNLIVSRARKMSKH